MKSLKARLIVVAAVLVAVAGVSVVAINVKNRNARRDAAVSETVWPDTLRDTPQDASVLDTVSPQAKLPVLTIGGQENPDVYLQSLDIQVEVTGNIASTRYTMVFKNKTNRILEGMLTFPLPDGRSATYYALDINGKMREAVPVEKAKGTQVFEEIQQRRVDPGLLERVEGNNLRTRVYPIPANGQRTVSIGYEEELTLEKDLLYYRLPMSYHDPLEKFAVKATVWKGSQKPLVPESEDEIRFDRAGEDYVASLARENYRPSRALIFALPAPSDIPQVIMQPAQGSQYFLASVAPKMETRKKQWGNDLAILWDVSLSGSQRNLKREIEMLDTVFADKKNANVHLYFLNNKFIKNGEYKVTDGKWDKLKTVLETAVFDGGTDFSQINLNNITGTEILFFSDGISTLSDAGFLKSARANRPIHCVVSAAKADYSAMKLIAGKTKGKFININALSSEKLKDELLNETLQYLGTEHDKAVREVYPGIATPVHGNFSVAGISGANDAEVTLLFGFGDKVEKRIKVQLSAKKATNQGNVYKIWAQKKIAELDLEYEKNRVELLELGQQFGIVTRNTSLIVLETIDDYVLYGIEPPASEPELRAEYRRRRSGSAKFRADASDGFGNDGVSKAEEKSRGSSSKSLRPAKLRSEGVSSNQGGGDPRARVTQQGVLGIVTGQIKGKSVASADVFGKGGFATDIDAILSGVGGLQSGGDGGGEGRKGVAGIGYGSGYGSGFGGGGGGIDDLLGGLMGSGGGSLDLKKRGELRVSSPDFLKGGALTGGRSRASIQRVVMQNVAALRYAYNRRLRDRPGLEGTITVKFAIDEFGKVISAQVVGSTINDAELESTVATRVKSWDFERIDKPGDVTEVTYPFVFSNGGGSAPTEETAETRERIARANEQTERERERASRPIEVVPQSRSGVSLYGAAAAAKNLKKWWSIDFAASQSSKTRYPVPDETGNASDIGSIKGGVIKNNDYLNKMTGKIADDYQTYLKLRNDYANSPVYYFDMANWFYTHGDRETALRVLTSIADLELENASLYRLLGYRFKEYGEYALEKFVCRKVVQWRPMEPQSYRDYALALADNGDAQGALDSLHALLTKPYSENILDRSSGIEEVIVTEINHLIMKNPRLNTSRIDKRLIVNTSVDIRVVLNWNMDNTDIDLHVKDPNGEECYYSYSQTKTGGRISADITSGYGPEQFLLKRAVKGKYQVYVNYFGDRQFTSAGPSTVMAEVYTKYAGKAEQRKVIALQMSNAKRTGDGKVVVAEFSF